MDVLDGLRVVDLGGGTAAALSSALLADLGADVITPVAADPRVDGSVDPDWLVAHRNKRLALSGDSTALAGLLDGCHVVVTGDESGLAGLGITADTVGSRVVLALSPLDRGTPPWAGGAEEPDLLAALSGLLADQSSFSGEPVDAVYPYLTYVHAAWAATCAVAALVERQRTGRGQLVHVGGRHATNVLCRALYARPGDEPDHPRADGPGGINPLYTRYRGSDSNWFYVGGLGPKFGRAVLEVTGSAHLLDDPRVGGRLERLWARDNTRWVMAHLVATFEREPAERWVKVLESADVPCTLLHDRDEWFDGAQVAASGLRREPVDPVLGPVVTPGSPVVVAGEPAPVRPVPPAAPIAATAWLGPDTWSATGDGQPGSGPLAGLRVASMGSFVAGPYAASLLAHLGADLVKIEPPAGDPWRLVGSTYNHGARSLAVDLRGAAGRGVVLEVLTACDLLLDNFRLGVTGRLGLRHDQLNRDGRNRGGRRIATVSVTAYGETGPLAERPGYDTVAQAATGIMSALGGDDEPVMSSLPNVDHTTATVGAFAGAVALLHLMRTGEAVHVATSLAAAAVYLQAPELTRFRGRGPGRIGGRDHKGPGPLDRIHTVRDGFVRIRADRLDVDSWRAAGIPVDDRCAAADPGAAVAAALAELTREQALAALTRAGVPAVPVRTAAQVVNDPRLHETGVLSWITGAGGVRLGTPGPLADFGAGPPAPVRPAPGLGEHSRELLIEAGHPAADIEQLEADGVIVTGPALEVVYLPPYR